MFVHGLFGHPRETWTSARSTELAAAPASTNIIESRPTAEVVRKKKLCWGFWKKNKDKEREGLIADGQALNKEPLFWPKELLPSVIPEACIYTWGYDVDINHIFSSASQATVFQYAASLLSDLADKRASNRDVSNLCFV